MVEKFKGFYEYSDNEMDALWKKAIFVFDTNILLNTYRYTEKTQKKLFEAIDKVKDRIWLPYQVGLEFQYRRIHVIRDEAESFERAAEKIRTDLKAIKSTIIINIRRIFNEGESREKFHGTLQSFEKNITDHINSQRDIFPDFITNDKNQIKIDALFKGRVGDIFSNEELAEIYKEAEERFAARLPPGFDDASKQGTSKYGDFVIWKEILRYASAKKTPIIFVTDDGSSESKSDWWIHIRKKEKRPHPFLVNEFWNQTDQHFYMYHSDGFIEGTYKHLGLKGTKDAVTEAKSVREAQDSRDELIRKLTKSFDFVKEPSLVEKFASFGRFAANEGMSKLAFDAVASVADKFAQMDALGARERISMMGLDAAIPAAGKLAEMDAMWIRQSMSKDGLGDTTVSEAQKRAGMDALGIGESISKIGLDAATSAAETYAARNPFETQEQIKNLEK